jgi:hypothetical protein
MAETVHVTQQLPAFMPVKKGVLNIFILLVITGLRTM